MTDATVRTKERPRAAGKGIASPAEDPGATCIARGDALADAWGAVGVGYMI